MAGPYYGAKADVLYGATTVAHARGITVGISGDVIKDYDFDSIAPGILEYGNQSYPVSIEKMYMDKEYASIILAKTKVNIQIRPADTETGSGKAVLLKNCVLPVWEITMTKDGAIIENMSGEGISMKFTSVA